jgi:type III restriction enzyme
LADVTIENPILNSAYEEPSRYFKFTDKGITNEPVEGRRRSGYFIPIPAPKKKGKQLSFETEWTKDRFEESRFINDVRERVNLWRANRFPGVTTVTRRLLDHWSNSKRDRRLFFCQREAAETAIYLTEIADREGDSWIANDLRGFNAAHNMGLYRLAFKMATGAGKTGTMGMLIAWHALNKLANPQDARFSDAFLLVCPGITIRDRLRVLLPNDPDNSYHALDLVPPQEIEQLRAAQVVITNFHAFLRREKIEASKTTKAILARGQEGLFTETPAEMVRRVCRDLGGKRNIVILNDEAHHCYRSKPDEEKVEGEKYSVDEKREAKKRDKDARVWISGLVAIQKKLGIRAIYDLSATPFFLKGSGYGEGTLFPWVVSDFSLIDAIEAGIVKVPRVPVADDSMTGDLPTYRELWHRIREDLPSKGRGTEKTTGDPVLPKELQGALQSLYGNYRRSYEAWEADSESRARGRTPPVFIIVCNNTNVSKLVFDHVSGYEKRRKDGTAQIGPDGQPILVPGALEIFSNVKDGRWLDRPNTILVDSEQIESGEGMSDEFKQIASVEIDEWKNEYRARFPGRDAESLTDEDLLREVMNTVGKPGKLGDGVRCVVSVSMLTEGWDANTVTHILGVRAFGTQLLCEQVVGRGLRRMSYALNAEGKFLPEYAEVYGVPFSFIPCAGASSTPVLSTPSTRVRALDDRANFVITFPRLIGYRYEIGDAPRMVKFGDDSKLALSTQDVPSKVENAPIVGERTIHTLDELRNHRVQEVEFLLAKLVIEKYFRHDGSTETGPSTEHHFEADVQMWRFPEVLQITRQWMREALSLKDNVFPQYLLLLEKAHEAADRIYRGIVSGGEGVSRLKPVLAPYDVIGSTRHVDFDTIRPVWPTRPDKSHVSHVVGDTGTWEQKVAQSLEEMDEVVNYVKNDHLGFVIPYTLADQPRSYYPDFLIRIDDGHGPANLLNLIVEVTGKKGSEKEVKVATARDLWIPAVNNDGSFGRWAFIENLDPWNIKNEIRTRIAQVRAAAVA